MAVSQVGFITVTTLAVCKVALIFLEIVFSKTRRSNAIILIIFGYVSAFLALVLGCIAFKGIRERGTAVESGRCENADADIVGDGVRAAAWTQVGILFFITLTGIFHCFKTAVKEIGGGLIVTHMSLAIALLVPLGLHQLSPIDAILGSLILDAQGNSLSIQLVTKETLASRWQVVFAVTAQVLGLIIEGILVGNFTANLLPTNNCNCFSVFWWSWFSNCSTASPNNVAPYWIYFGYRVINIAHGSYIAITRTRTFNDAEKWDIENRCDPCNHCRKRLEEEVTFHGEANPQNMIPLQQRNGQRAISQEWTPHKLCVCDFCAECRNCRTCKRKKRCDQHQPNTQNVPCEFCVACHHCTRCGHSDLNTVQSVLLSGERFSAVTVTVSAGFLESSVLALLSMISAEVTMNVNNVQKTSPLYAVGQVTALIIALGTAARALWVFLYMFDGRTHSSY